MSVSEWREVRIDEVISFNPSESLKKGEIAKKIAMEQIEPFTRKIANYELSEFTGGSKFRNGDTLFARITPCLENGKTAYVNILDDNEVAFGSTEFIVMRKKEKITDDMFVYYLAISPDFRNKAIQSMTGTSGRQRVQQDVLQSHKIMLPPLHEQKAIAATLSALDDMIELNNQINKTLEEMAQAIFKSWFVDFEPFKDGEFEESELGLIPKGWNVKRIDQIDIEITDYVANGSFAALKENVTLCDEEDYAVFIRNVDLKANSFNKFVDKKSYEFLRKTKLWGGEVIISNVGDVGSVFRCPLLAKPMTLGNNMIMLKSISPVNYNLFLYILFKYSYGIELIKSITSGSAQPKFNKTDFRNLKIIVPPKEVIQLFNNIVEKLYRIVDEGIVENQLLSTVRDTLLPKLMSGEIRVPVEGAM